MSKLHQINLGRKEDGKYDLLPLRPVPTNRLKLQALAEQEKTSMSEVVRTLIDTEYEKRFGKK